MKNKEIHDRRVKGYFIEATKEILKAEGVQALSVRTISDKAGYSYATLYNYFTDLNDLIQKCISDFLNDCKKHVENQVGSAKIGKDRIAKVALSFIKYYVEYPGLFVLLFLENSGLIGNDEEVLKSISLQLDQLCVNDWEAIAANSSAAAPAQEAAKEQLRHITVGLLVLYINRAYPSSYKDFMAKAQDQINSVIEEL